MQKISLKWNFRYMLAAGHGSWELKPQVCQREPVPSPSELVFGISLIDIKLLTILLCIYWQIISLSRLIYAISFNQTY